MKLQDKIVERFRKKQFSDVYSNREWYTMGSEDTLEMVIDVIDKIMEDNEEHINASEFGHEPSESENQTLDNTKWILLNGDIDQIRESKNKGE